MTGRGNPLGTEWPGVERPLIVDADVIQLGERESRDADFAWPDVSKRPVTSVGRGSSRPAVCLITAAGKGATISTRGAASGRSGDCAAHVQS